MRHPLGALVFIQKGMSIKAVRFIDKLAVAFVSDADFIPARDMKDAIHALHWLAQALFLCDIALVNPHTRPKLPAGLHGIARENHNFVSSFKQLTYHATTDKAGRAGDKVFHLFPTFRDMHLFLL